MNIIKKSRSLHALLCLGFLSGSIEPNLSPKALTECYEGRDSSFKYLEFIFIEQPKNQLKEAIRSVQTSMIAILTAAVLSSQYYTAKPDTDFIKSNPSISFGVLGLGKIVYDLYNDYLDQSIKKAQLIKFLNNWDFHRQYIPTQLTTAFDELAQAYASSKSKTLTTQQVSEIFAVIQHLIEHEFAKRYEKDKMKDADTLSIMKTVTEIKKNL